MSELGHLVRRFFEVTLARSLSPREQTEAAALLGPTERALFWAQPSIDQRHGLEAARRVLAAAPGRRDLANAALLHDVGKRHARLGIIGRSLASGLALLRLPVRGRLADYLDHGPAGARDLAVAEAAPTTVDFAEHHHGNRPPSISPAEWELLQEADGERKPQGR